MRSFKFFFLACICSTFLFSACGDDPDVNEIVSDFYFQATVDGEIYTYQVDVNDYINIFGDWGRGGIAGNSRQYVPFTCIASEDALSSPSGLSNSGAIGVIITDNDSVGPAQVGEMMLSGSIGIGTRSYGASQEAVEGGFLSWIDGSGREWTTNGPQSNASFAITEYFDQEDPVNFTHKVIAAEFSCTLYNGLGGSIVLNDGIARGRLIVY